MLLGFIMCRVLVALIGVVQGSVWSRLCNSLLLGSGSAQLAQLLKVLAMLVAWWTRVE